MKTKTLCLLLLVGFSFHAQAITLSFDPAAQNVGFGETVTVDLRISDLGDDILTGFDIDVSFDDSLLGFDSFSFGLGLDTFGFGTFNDVVDFGGTVNVFEVSFDFDADLMDFQPNDFVLGTFTFTGGFVFGTSALDVTFSLLSGEFDVNFNPIELFPVLESGSITVPEPATLLLLVGGLLGIAVSRRAT